MRAGKFFVTFLQKGPNFILTFYFTSNVVFVVVVVLLLLLTIFIYFVAARAGGGGPPLPRGQHVGEAGQVAAF
jgi:hypothetical protein